MRVVYSERTVADIAEIFDYIEQQDHVTARAAEADIRRACEGFSQFPHSNPKTSRPNFYRMPIKRRGFSVFYRVRSRLRVVEIARVVRSARVRNLGRVPRR